MQNSTNKLHFSQNSTIIRNAFMSIYTQKYIKKFIATHYKLSFNANVRYKF